MKKKAAPIQLMLNVNGKEHQLLVHPQQTLLGVLRDDLGLTGTKQGCDDGACGTCMVTVNGAMARACRVFVDRAQGKEVVTIEGLGTPERLHPLQEAFIKADAVQCGFCTPGVIMAAKALLDRNPAPTREQIAKALGSNLCRCTGYTSILEAVARAADLGRGIPYPELQGAGEAHRRIDAQNKVLGAALYAADLNMPGMLHGAILRSPHFHAGILHIDDSEARALPGVAAVVTARDVPGLNRHGRAIKDQPVLADGRVRQIGDAVAAVAATSPEVAAQALSLIRVSYRLLPAIADPAEALKEGAPLIHDSGNLLAEKDVHWGDAEAALAAADIMVDETYTTPFSEHAYLEPEAALAYRDDAGQLVVRSATQYAHLHRRAVAETMGLPLEQVRIQPTVVGGAFGAKTDISCECVVALLALKTGRPVKIVYTRAESFASTTKRHPFRMRCRTGVTRDGRLIALAADLLADTGAYASAGPGVMTRAFVSLVGPYQFPNVAIHGRVVYTNNTTAGAMRGYGAPQVAFAIESQMDIMAAKLGIDPLEFRLMNRRRSSAAEATPQDIEQEAAYRETVEAVRPYYENALRARQASASGNGRWRRGVGIASMRYGIGYAAWQPPEVAVELESDGRVRIFIGSIDMGQGTDTAMGLIAAGELALPLEAVSVVSGDTALTPDTGASSGSRVIYTDGNAVMEAAVRLREAILSTASGLMDISYESLELRDARVAPRKETGISGPTVSLADVARARQSTGLPLRFKGNFHPIPLRDSLSGGPSPYLVHVSATHMAEVEVDMEKGAVRVLRVVAAHDVGRVIYAQGLKGQIEGAVSMGMGFALREEFHPGETTGFKQYRLPTARETPEVISLMVEMVDPSASLGAKGAAECATVAVAPAIANAIADATGTRIHHLPATPPRLLALIGGAPG
ncbi:MAG: molybdopterin-dependent oxidoreductase [Betaproteobacteria bacterium]|nr:molybdopterin-dependent oxidoreductase [Betaproteobacteria bacterium]